MDAVMIRERLHNFIDKLEDKKAEAIYLLFENDIDPEAQRKKIILAERERHLRGEGRTYSFEEVKAMARDKQKRDDL